MSLSKYIDHTLLRADAKEEDIYNLCQEAIKHQFASVCVNPSYVSYCADLLKGTDVKVCTVVGFPLGATDTSTKVYETKQAILNGATEIDMVINIGKLKNKNLDYVKKEVDEIVNASSDKIVKVIIETSLLSEEEKIDMCNIIKDSKANYIKTSTGFSTGGATKEDVILFKKYIGDKIKIKASGGIRNYEDAMAFIDLGVSRIGTSSGVAIVSKIDVNNNSY